MSWLSLVIAVISILQSITKYLADRQIIKATEAANTAAVLGAARRRSDEITAQMDAAARAATPDDKLPNDGSKDPYQRD